MITKMTQKEIQSACHQFGLNRSQVVEGFGSFNGDEVNCLIVTSLQAANAVQAAIAEYYDMTVSQFRKADESETDGLGRITQAGKYWKVTC
jgi:hypothetical protein